jgi:hypothetical protein
MTCSYQCEDGIVYFENAVYRCRCKKGDRFEDKDMRNKWEIKMGRPPIRWALVPEQAKAKPAPIGRERAAGKDE